MPAVGTAHIGLSNDDTQPIGPAGTDASIHTLPCRAVQMAESRQPGHRHDGSSTGPDAYVRALWRLAKWLALTPPMLLGATALARRASCDKTSAIYPVIVPERVVRAVVLSHFMNLVGILHHCLHASLCVWLVVR